MPVEWETFDKRNGRLIKQPEVTVQAAGTMSLNAAAAHLIGDAEAIELLYNRDANFVGIRPCPPETAHAYPMRPVGSERGTFVINSRMFFQYYELPIGTAIRRDVRVEDGVLIVDLNDPGRIAIANRKKKSTATGAANGNGHAPVEASSPI